MITKTRLMSGNEAAVQGALDAGAEIMFGYPITPASEILEDWIIECEQNNKRRYLQTEDEICAGFGVLGAVLGGTKAFTASAGPGHILMQDPISMAENMRLPFVGIMMQRGGPSTGTVNFSQQEVNLAAFGGNGDGLRIVYSASTIEEMYRLVFEAFSAAWKFRFPTIVLGDGYLGKMHSTVTFKKQLNPVTSSEILAEKIEPTHLRNCYSSEESFGIVLRKNIDDWQKAASKVVQSEEYKTKDATSLIIAHGLVASACKEAVSDLRRNGQKIGLFRPITLHPLDKRRLLQVTEKIRLIYIIESSLNQFSRMMKYELAGLKFNIREISKPAEGFSAEEIINRIRIENGR